MASGLRKGEPVRVRRLGHEDEWCPAIVHLVSANGKSVMLSLDGCVHTNDGGLACAALPLSIDYETKSVTGLDGTEYEIEVKD